MKGELDQVLAQYREQLKKISSLLAQVTHLGQSDVMMSNEAEEMINKLERSVANYMDKQLMVERARQAVLDLKMVLDISRQTVEAKSKHLGQEEKQKEEAQTLRFKEFQKIHRLQDEKALLERELIPARHKLSEISQVLEEKYEKKRIIENFHNTLAEHCADDMLHLKDMTDEARADRYKWDNAILDISEEIRALPPDAKDLKNLHQRVCELREVLRNQKRWYDEEMHTKLFYSTRCKEIKHRIHHLQNLLRRFEKTGESEDLQEELEEKRYSHRSEHILVDGTPGVHAKEVERYLCQQFGMKVLADYTMLRRLKEEIGVQGLAYLVEKVRLQGGKGLTSVPLSGPYVDWEEKQVEQALMNIAFEYRDREENKRMLSVPGVGSDISRSTDDSQHLAMSDFDYPSASYLSAPPGTSARSATPDSSLASNTMDSGSSSSSAKKRASLSRFRKFLKL